MFCREDMKGLGYLTQCIKEAMRLHSPVPFIGRVTHQDTEVCGKRIPAGVNTDIVIHNLHHNPHVWGHDHQVTTQSTSMNGAPYTHLYGEPKWRTALTVSNFKRYF
jgi:hypothetical protein